MTNDDSTSGLRSTAVRAMTLVILSTILIVGAVYVAIDRLDATASNAVEHPGPAATAAQTQTELVEQARDIVAIADLHRPTAGYLLMSCRNRDDPPYQGAVYLDFELPSGVDPDQYFRGVAAAMVARGWREGPPPNQHVFGRNLSKDGVNALVYPDRDSATHGVARIYGRCRDVTDLRGKKTDWVDVTDRLHSPR